MAKYSDSRELNREIKYLYKVWSGVDSQIKLPASLTSDTLLQLINDVPAPVVDLKLERQARRKIKFSPHFTWKSGATYAAALVLIVALSAMFGRGTPNPELVEGIVPPEEQSQQVVQERQQETAEVALGSDTHMASEQPGIAEQQPQRSENSVSEVGTSEIAESQPASHSEETLSDTETTAFGIGGQSASIVLGQDDTYIYTYRYNDESDPDKEGVPVTVNIVHESSGALAFSIDLTELQSIDQYFLYEQTVAFIGQSVSGGIVLEAYDLSQVGEPVRRVTLEQPGQMMAVNQYKSLGYLVSYAPEDSDPGCEITELPDAIEGGLCVLTALNLETMETARVAYLGAGEEISLYNLNAYLSYQGEKDEQHEQGIYVAHVRLDGMNLELRDVQ